MQKIRVIKMKPQNSFELPRYKAFIDNKEIKGITLVSVSVKGEEKMFGLNKVNIQIITNDFEWLNEESAELLADSPAETESKFNVDEFNCPLD